MAFHLSTVWITRQSDDTPELVVAWDNFTIDDNPQGWEDAKAAALAAIGDDVRDTAYLDIIVPEEPIFDALYPPDVPATKVLPSHSASPS